MKNKVLLFIVILFCFSCNDEKQKLRKSLKEFRSNKIKITYPLKSYSITNGWDFYTPKHKFQLVSYIDGTCPMCLNELGLWNEYITNHHEKLDYLLFVKCLNINDIKYFLEQIDYTYEIIPDTSDIFLKQNILVRDEQFHTFLMDTNKNVHVVGNPTQIKAIDELIWKYINE